MNCLIVGNSFAVDNGWPGFLFNQSVQVRCHAFPASGNELLSQAVMQAVIEQPTDFVLMIASSVNRLDLRLPGHEFFSRPSQYRSNRIGDSIWYCGHGQYEISPRLSARSPGQVWIEQYQLIRDRDWPDIKSITDWLNLSHDIKRQCINRKLNLITETGGDVNSDSYVAHYHLMQTVVHDVEYLSERSWQALMSCFDFLARRKIPWKFCFGSDPWNRSGLNPHRQAAQQGFYHEIDWSRCIDLPPHEFGVAGDYLEDGYHLTAEGMKQWAIAVNQQLRTEPELTAFLADGYV